MQEMQVRIPGEGRTHGKGNGNPLQYSCLENSMDRGAWWATVHGVAKTWTHLSTAQHRECVFFSPSGSNTFLETFNFILEYS